MEFKICQPSETGNRQNCSQSIQAGSESSAKAAHQDGCAYLEGFLILASLAACRYQRVEGHQGGLRVPI